MKRPVYKRRYLAPFDARRLPHVFTDCLVLGGGIAGLRAALEASKSAQVLIVAKDALEECNTYRAQGGVAAAMSAGDSVEGHVADTISVAVGLADPEAVRLVCSNAPAAMEELMEIGVPFDRTNGTLDLAREAAHSQNRILHVHGDATGSGIHRPLSKYVLAREQVQIRPKTFVIDLLTAQNTCLGALAYQKGKGMFLIWAKCTILASGGIGQLFRETTNSPIATGDGMAMAYRAGAILQDMEMIQFHPTTLYMAGASRALISEALRGEGAHLVNRHGERFMNKYHPLGELAPRDVVARAIVAELARTSHICVYLDVRHFGVENFKKRFPSIYDICRSFDIDVGKDLIPVRPSAHYMMGGVATDLEARTSIHRLYACGEVACTGLHGANRLASNSLLEGLVFGRIAGAGAGRIVAASKSPTVPRPLVSKFEYPARPVDLDDLRNSVRAVMWRNVGIERDEQGLRDALDEFDAWSRYALNNLFDSPHGWEWQNMLQIGYLCANAALARTESRGAHFRKDLPDLDPAQAHRYAFRWTTRPKPRPIAARDWRLQPLK